MRWLGAHGGACLAQCSTFRVNSHTVGATLCWCITTNVMNAACSPSSSGSTTAASKPGGAVRPASMRMYTCKHGSVYFIF